MPAGFFILIVAAVVIAVLFLLLAGVQGELTAGLKRLGEPVGKTEADFVRAFKRQPTSISTPGTGLRLLQWQAGGQHLAIQFTDHHRFVRITHRHKV